MKRVWEDILHAFVMGMVVPGLILALLVMYWEKDGRNVSEETKSGSEAAALPILVRWPDETVTQMDMDAYLTGVVLAEMPAWFETEALKAQSVAARTFARKAYLTGGKHGDGSVCTDYTCCQAYLSEEDYRAKGGAEADIQKVRKAVWETSGYVLTYDGALIEAVYFSCSGGRTEDAVDVWGTDYPYLRGVDSPGEENASVFAETKTFTKEEIDRRLGTELTGQPEQWLGEVKRTAGGGVDTMQIGGTVYAGTFLRTVLELRSTAFSASVRDGTVVIETRGYGHRVGMSQYGADAMAASGFDFKRILSHYYPGTALEKVSSKE